MDWLTITWLWLHVQNAIAVASVYDKCRALTGKDRIACQLDKAIVNVGSVLAGRVAGRVSIEVDPRISKDTGESHQYLRPHEAVPKGLS